MRLCITLLGLILGAGAQALESLSKQELLALCGSGKKGARPRVKQRAITIFQLFRKLLMAGFLL